MSDFKRKLDKMMGDTSMQERRIKQRIHENFRAPVKKPSWQVPFVTAAIAVVALFLFITFNPLEQLSSNEGPEIPYDPLDDLAQISALQKKQLLSAIRYEKFAELPHFDKVDGLHYVDRGAFSLEGSDKTFHTVIERKANLYDSVVYQVGDIVRTMTNTTSHLPTYADAYYEVVAVPGDRVVLKNGQLKVNGKPLKSEILDYYEENSVTIVGGYDQLLNAREYFLINHFPASETVQAGTITPVHKIYGEVVGLATEENTESIYFAKEGANAYTAEQYFDLFLYDGLFGDGHLAQSLIDSKTSFTQTNRLGELFLEAAYRKLSPISDNRVEVRYQYGRAGVNEHVFYMEQQSNTGIWVVSE
ncbi:S26 family signal peptidase [Metasolibacillus meyeri]|uniref:S26 family signal peptidase n=1 Tax=Metasolibacillus meyeri TaxID=1071052 RepID=UPI000D326B41|nr:S26 family signal peptidase [Metasolibacillus meyeri]